MKDGTDIGYKEENGVFNPDIQISNEAEADTTPLGKYGQMCYKYLRDEHPDRFAVLRMEGELMPLLHNINDEAHQRIEWLTNELMKRYSDGSYDTMVHFRRRNAVREVAEEVVIREFVLIPRYDL